MPIGNAPAFRSFPPTTASNRIFPAIKNVIFDTPDKTEALPQTDRDFTFRCTVRDQHQGRSAVEWATLDFRATSNAGPFEITYPTERNIQLTGGSQMEVLWDVANTSQPPVNCQLVDIYLSLDGGYTYPHLLAQNTPNDGRASVFLPDTTAPLARVKVAAADNIFFNISQFSFSISAATAPGFAANLFPETLLDQCLPTTIDFTVNTSAVLGYQEPIQLSTEGAFPEGTLIEFTSNPVQPGTATQLQLTPPDNVSGTFEGKIILQSGNLPPVELPFTFSTLSNNFDDLLLVHPANGSSDVEQNPVFRWTPTPNAEKYQIQVSPHPQMDPLVVDREDLLTDTFLNNVPLESNQLFFWRLLPSNQCAPTQGTPIQAFHTLNNVCETTNATDVPINISGTGLPEVISTINIPFDGVVNDVNIPLIKANYQPVNSLQVSLISPSGTEVMLFDRECGNTVNLLVGFDDQAGFPLECPPDDGIVFKPLNPLSAFKGQNAKGDWKLKVKVARSGFGASGGLDAWRLEVCASFEPQYPTLNTNEKLGVRPGNRNTITRDYLWTTDPDNTSSEITYTLVTLPQSGFLSLDGATLEVGSTFSQSDIDQNLLRYQNTAADATQDGFTFVVQDGTGGWIPITRFELVMDDNAITSRTEEEWNQEWDIFPNPAEQGVFIHLKQPLEARTRMAVTDLLGRPISQIMLEKNTMGNIPLQINKVLPSGKYIVSLFSDKGQSHKSFIILSN
jgi:subtilisin-like proprotein convertase family protein